MASNSVSQRRITDNYIKQIWIGMSPATRINRRSLRLLSGDLTSRCDERRQQTRETRDLC